LKIKIKFLTSQIALQEPVDFSKVKVAQTLDPTEQVVEVVVAPEIEVEEEGMDMEEGKANQTVINGEFYQENEYIVSE
jgi:hypothetical protein